MVDSFPRLAAALIVVTVVMAGCAHTRGHAPPEPRLTQTGNASWYGRAHQGKKTASGEPFDMNALTAAHRTLPLGSRVRVTNLANGRVVDVRVNDRGPVLADRIIDISYAAARELDAVSDGVFRVRIAVIE